VVDPVSLAYIKEFIDVYSLSELRGGNHDELFLVDGISEELLESVLDCVRLMLVDGVKILIKETKRRHTFILLEDELGSFYVSLDIKPWYKETILECLLSLLGRGDRRKDVLHTNKLD